jgi:SAM-dependent methyltransferase
MATQRRRPRWDTRSVLDAALAFQESRILLTAVELDLFTMLARKGWTGAALARGLKTDARATAMLLDALTAMGLLSKTRGAYRTAADVAPLLDARGGRSCLPVARHFVNLWRTWDGLTGIVHTGRPPTLRQGPRTGADLRSFIGAMAVIAAPQASRIVRAIRPGRARRLLDVGGGPGTYTAAFLKACPDLRATLFDLAPVVAIARTELRKAGLLGRVKLVPGNFMTDPLPGGQDLAYLSAIIHQMSLHECGRLYRKVHAALVPGGRLVIRDHVMDPTRIRPRAGAIFAINMLVGTKGGGTYTFAEIRQGLEAAGFRDVTLLRGGGMMDSLVSARRPGALLDLPPRSRPAGWRR